MMTTQTVFKVGDRIVVSNPRKFNHNLLGLQTKVVEATAPGASSVTISLVDGRKWPVYVNEIELLESPTDLEESGIPESEEAAEVTPETIDECLKKAVGFLLEPEGIYKKSIDAGVTDERLAELIGNGWGLGVGSSTPFWWSAKGGKSPKFWQQISCQGKPTLQGKKLIQRVRKLLEIPEPIENEAIAPVEIDWQQEILDWHRREHQGECTQSEMEGAIAAIVCESAPIQPGQRVSSDRNNPEWPEADKMPSLVWHGELLGYEPFEGMGFKSLCAKVRWDRKINGEQLVACEAIAQLQLCDSDPTPAMPPPAETPIDPIAEIEAAFNGMAAQPPEESQEEAIAPQDAPQVELITAEIVPSDSERLQALEAEIEAGVSLIEQGKQQVMQAIATIRSENLWQLGGHKSFEAYAKARFGWAKSNAHEMASAGETMTTLIAAGADPVDLPDAAAAYRPLKNLPTDQAVEVIQVAARKSEGKPTAAAVKAAIAEVAPNPEQIDPQPLDGPIICKPSISPEEFNREMEASRLARQEKFATDSYRLELLLSNEQYSRLLAFATNAEISVQEAAIAVIEQLEVEE